MITFTASARSILPVSTAVSNCTAVCVEQPTSAMHSPLMSPCEGTLCMRLYCCCINHSMAGYEFVHISPHRHARHSNIKQIASECPANHFLFQLPITGLKALREKHSMRKRDCVCVREGNTWLTSSCCRGWCNTFGSRKGARALE